MAGLPLASTSDAALVLGNRKSCPIGYWISGPKGWRLSTLQTLWDPWLANADSTCSAVASDMTPTENRKRTGPEYMLAHLVHTLDGFKPAFQGLIRGQVAGRA